MPLSGQVYIKAVQERGIPEAWQEFGWLLSNQAALSTRLVAMARELYDNSQPEAREQFTALLDDLDKNLGRARTVIDEKLADYDACGRWQQLDQAVLVMDINDVIGVLLDTLPCTHSRSWWSRYDSTSATWPCMAIGPSTR